MRDFQGNVTEIHDRDLAAARGGSSKWHIPGDLGLGRSPVWTTFLEAGQAQDSSYPVSYRTLFAFTVWGSPAWPSSKDQVGMQAVPLTARQSGGKKASKGGAALRSAKLLGPGSGPGAEPCLTFLKGMKTCPYPEPRWRA